MRRLIALVFGLLDMPPGRSRIALALAYGVVCHVVFALTVGAMVAAMFFGMSKSFGRVPQPWSYVANASLILQFPLTHSILLGDRGAHWLNCFAPKDYAQTLSTTTYAFIASLQLLTLFALWTPSEVIWWRADGIAL